MDAQPKILREAFNGTMMAMLGEKFHGGPNIGFVAYDQRLLLPEKEYDIVKNYRRAINTLLRTCPKESVLAFLHGGVDGRTDKNLQKQSAGTQQFLLLAQRLKAEYPEINWQCAFPPPGSRKIFPEKALLAIPDQKEIVLFEELYEKPKYVRLNKRLYTL